MRITRTLLASLALAAVTSSGAVMATGAPTVAATRPAAAARPNVVVLQGKLTAAQVVSDPKSASTATGKVIVRIDTVAATITTDMEWSGLSGPADRTHIHSGLFGQSRTDVIFHEIADTDNVARTVDCSAWGAYVNCLPASGSVHDVWDVSAGAGDCPDVLCIADLALAQNTYVDIHTEAYAGGEIRAQLKLVNRRPDALVRAGRSRMVGDDIYNATGRNQQAAGSGAGKTLRFQVQIQNDAQKFDDSYGIRSTGALPAGYTLQVLAGDTDITAQVRDGTYVTPDVAPGSSLSIVFLCHIEGTAKKGSATKQLVKVTSQGDPTKVDAVKVVASRP